MSAAARTRPPASARNNLTITAATTLRIVVRARNRQLVVRRRPTTAIEAAERLVPLPAGGVSLAGGPA